jgi:hypothetical protein
LKSPVPSEKRVGKIHFYPVSLPEGQDSNYPPRAGQMNVPGTCKPHSFLRPALKRKAFRRSDENPRHFT